MSKQSEKFSVKQFELALRMYLTEPNDDEKNTNRNYQAMETFGGMSQRKLAEIVKKEYKMSLEQLKELYSSMTEKHSLNMAA